MTIEIATILDNPIFVSLYTFIVKISFKKASNMFFMKAIANMLIPFLI